MIKAEDLDQLRRQAESVAIAAGIENAPVAKLARIITRLCDLIEGSSARIRIEPDPYPNK